MTNIEDIKAVFEYNAATGVVSRRRDGHMGWDNGKGYLIFRFQGKTLSAHRIAWLLHYGESAVGGLDHINGDKRDNRIENLRAATDQQNNANRRGWRNSLSGAKGVSRKNGRWFAQIMVNRKNIHLGYFDTVPEASKAYEAAAKMHFGEYARAA